MKKSKKLWLGVAIVALIGVSLVGVYRNRQQAMDDNVIRIGAIVFLTGPQSATGKDVLNGIILSKTLINESGGICKKKVELIVEDSKDSPKEAIKAFNRLCAAGVSAIVVSGDVITFNLAHLITQKKIPVLSVVAEADNVANLSKYIFRAWVSDSMLIDKISKYAYKEIKDSRLSIIAINNEFGQSSSRNFKQNFTALGGNICSQEYYNISDVDVRGQIYKCMRENPKAFFVTGFGDGYGTSINQIRESGFTGKIYTSIMMSLDFYQQQTMKSNEGIVFAATSYSPSSRLSESRYFVAEYGKRIGGIPNFTSAFSYESLNILRFVIEENGASNENIIKGLENLKKYKSVFGEISYNSKREIDLPIWIWQMKNSKAQILAME